MSTHQRKTADGIDRLVKRGITSAEHASTPCAKIHTPFNHRVSVFCQKASLLVILPVSLLCMHE